MSELGGCMLKGIGVSKGFAIGYAFVLEEEKIEIVKKIIDNPDLELERFRNAINETRIDLERIILKTSVEISFEESKIFEAHLMMLEDFEIIDKTRELILKSKINSEYAYQNVINEYLTIFSQIEDEYLRERANDLRDVSRKVIRRLINKDQSLKIPMDKQYILIAKELEPSYIAQLNPNNILGIVTEEGSITSHTAIISRTLGLSAVVGVEGLFNYVHHLDLIIVDGEKGEVFVNPDNEMVAVYVKKQKEHMFFREKLKEMIGKKTVTKDRYEVELSANIGMPKDLKFAMQNDCEGVGLFRTEFLYMESNTLPSEEFQFESYKKVAQELDGKSVIIRTIDIGGDKELSCMELDKEMNPFMGVRAIRLCLINKDIFITQLRSILRASAFGNVKIMFPMISCMEELKAAKDILEEVKNQLRIKKQPFDEKMEVGIMIEIPSAALISDDLAKEVDFFSIGTNDLIQYSVAVDRTNRNVSHLYSQYHPGVLRLIKQVADNAKKANIWIGMCGEAASNPKLIPLFVGMGFKELSMNASSILQARRVIRELNKEEISKQIHEIIGLSSATEVEMKLSQFSIYSS
jgi:phosphoenolpyruvate-protein phosphotransferase (PTS system enzyme I)